MFGGRYTTDKCLGTCWTRSQLRHCGTTFSITQVQAVDQEALRKQLSNKTSEEVHDCIHDNEEIRRDVVDCSDR